MPTKEYFELYNNYWPKASELILELLLQHIAPKDTILEIGAGSGHILFQLLSKGYLAEGCEIREEQFLKTQNLLKKMNYENALFCKDIMTVEKKYDLIYTTGLLQCLTSENRHHFISKISSLSPKAIIVIPEILTDRNNLSKKQVGVAGCSEYITSSIAYELSKFFDFIKIGFWPKELLNLDDNFQYFICKNRDIKN